MSLVGERWIYWLEELSKEHLDVVGKKCANLAELMRAGFRVPPGFALGLTAYERFMEEKNVLRRLKNCLDGFQGDPHNLSDAPKYEEAAEAMRKITESQAMPDDMANGIMTYYDGLCRKTGIDQVPVSIRSAGPVSHPGQYETSLHIRGATDVIKNIIKVWSSTFNQRSLLARAREGLPMDFDPIGVAVIRMVDAKSAGVMFTVNPLSGDVSRIRIEANWGLGESVVSGAVTPDEWMVDKVTLEISHRRIRRKEEEFCVDSDTGTCRYASVPRERQEIPCLSDEEVIKLAKIGKKIEQHFGTIQDIEWAIERDSPIPQDPFMLQTRAGQALEREREIVRSGNATDIIAGLWRSKAPHP